MLLIVPDDDLFIRMVMLWKWSDMRLSNCSFSSGRLESISVLVLAVKHV